MQSNDESAMPDPRVFRAIVEQMPEAIILADRAGTIRIWNHGAEAIFGYPASEALGRNLDLIIPEHLRRAHWAGYERAMAAGTVSIKRVMTTRSMHRDGSKLYLDLSFTIILDEAGAVIGALAVGRDVTARQLAAAAAAGRGHGAQ